MTCINFKPEFSPDFTVTFSDFFTDPFSLVDDEGTPTDNLVLFIEEVDGSMVDTIGLLSVSYALVDDSLKSLFYSAPDTPYDISTCYANALASPLLNVSELVGSVSSGVACYAGGVSQDVIDTAINILNVYQEFPAVDMQAQILSAGENTILHDFQTDIIQTYGTVEYDTSVKYSGSRSLKITTPAAQYAIGRVDLGAGGVDLSGSNLSIMARLDSSGEDLSKLQFYLWTSDFTLIAKYECPYGGALMLSKDEWQLVTLSGNSAISASGNVRYIDIMPSAKTTTAAIVNFNELRETKKTTNGYVTITLDGAYIEQYTILKPIFDARGYKPSLMISQPSAIDGESTAYMSKTQLKECEAAGWDISTHSGVDVTALTEQELRALAIDRKKWLKDNGFSLSKGGRFFCALQDNWNELAADVLGEYFYFMRTGYGPILQSVLANPTLPVFNPRAIPDIAANATYAQQAALVEACAEHRQWGVFTWHYPGKVGELTTQQTIDMCDLIDSLGLEVVTFSDVADKILNL